ncbi:hypothetical protein [Spirosoma aerophilum]
MDYNYMLPLTMVSLTDRELPSLATLFISASTTDCMAIAGSA